MRVRNVRSNCLVMLAVLLLSSIGSATAADKTAASAAAPGNITEVWSFWPKAGHDQDFQTAIKQYAAWRKSAGETFTWSIFQPIVGDDLAYYVIRSSHHQWKDFDANAAWGAKSKEGDKFGEQVGPYVERSAHYFSETDPAHSHWTDSKDYKYFSVDSYAMKSGTHAEQKDALDKMQKAVVDAKWAYSYQIEHQIGGTDPMMIITPMKSYAEMADPEPSLMKVMSKSLGSDTAAAAAMKEFGGAIDHHSNTIYAYRADLSTPQ